MTRKLIASVMVLGAVSLANITAFAAINRPIGHKQGNTYEECSVECNDFVDAKGCREFRQANLICTEKKKSTWPIITAQVLEEMEE